MCISFKERPTIRLFPWSRGLRRRSAAACLLRLWVRIALEIWMSDSCECCVLRQRSLLTPTDCGASCVIQKPHE